jgi:hypothetical protein
MTYVAVNGKIYMCSSSAVGMLMKCIPTHQGKELLEIHAGICGHHAAPRSPVGKAFFQGFYWPIALHDAEEVVCTCKGC